MNALTQVAASANSPLNINLTDFIDEFGDELLESLNRSNPPVYTGSINEQRQAVMASLKRTPFVAQAEVVQAITALLLDRNEQAAIINAEMGPVEVWESCQVDESAKGLLQAAMKQMHLSARGFHRILKVSRTIADLAEVETIGISHLAEALQYRPASWG